MVTGERDVSQLNKNGDNGSVVRMISYSKKLIVIFTAMTDDGLQVFCNWLLDTILISMLVHKLN